jgi:hypothetical protein
MSKYLSSNCAVVEQLCRLVPVRIVAFGIVSEDAVGHSNHERITVDAVTRPLDERQDLAAQRMLAEREVLDRDHAGLQAFELAYEDVATRLDQLPQFLGTTDIEDIGVGVDAE